MTKRTQRELEEHRLAAHSQHTDIAPESVREIAAASLRSRRQLQSLQE